MGREPAGQRASRLVLAVETLPDGAENIVYTNYLGQVLLSEFKDGTDSWIEHFKYSTDSHLIQHAQPSAVSSYDDTQADLGVLLKASSGLIRVTDYYSTSGSGAAEGHVEFAKIKNPDYS